MESVQDLLAPEKDNCHIQEDPKTGDVSVPGATQIQLTDHQSFCNLLDVGEANRFAANTKLNTESSRSHAILLVRGILSPLRFVVSKHLVSHYDRIVFKPSQCDDLQIWYTI